MERRSKYLLFAFDRFNKHNKITGNTRKCCPIVTKENPAVAYENINETYLYNLSMVIYHSARETNNGITHVSVYVDISYHTPYHLISVIGYAGGGFSLSCSVDTMHVRCIRNCAEHKSSAYKSHSRKTMMTSSNGNIFRVTGPLCGEFTGPGEFPAQRPVTRSFDVFFDERLNKRLSKQPRGWWFETPSWSLWRHCNDRWKHMVRTSPGISVEVICNAQRFVVHGHFI